MAGYHARHAPNSPAHVMGVTLSLGDLGEPDKQSHYCYFAVRVRRSSDVVSDTPINLDDDRERYPEPCFLPLFPGRETQGVVCMAHRSTMQTNIVSSKPPARHVPVHSGFEVRRRGEKG